MPTTSPSQEAFDRLLLRLNSDRERAGEEYELLRLKLLEYFRSRACLCAEELADETLNRLAKKVVEGEEVREIMRYCYGLAHWVLVEYRRNPQSKQIEFENKHDSPVSLPDPLVQKERLECFRYCFGKQSAEEREVMIKYCDHTEQPHYGARREMAEQMGISQTALRIRVSRIKNKLKACFSRCLEHGLTNLKRF